MKILVYSSVFYPGVGGLEILTLNLIHEFIKEGHEVKVITSEKQTVKLKNIEVIHPKNVLASIKCFFWCDVYYMPNISLKGVWLLLFNPFKKWVVSHNDFSLQNHTDLSTKIKLLFIKFTTQNIAVSNSVAKGLKTKSHVVYNCYDDDIFKLQPETGRLYDLLFVGRFVSQKGCDTLINACAIINIPFTLNIIGDGPEKNNLVNLVSKHNLQNQVKFLGMLRDAELVKALNQHKTLVVPSKREEGFGIVVLEGMACGCNIIAADAGGLREAAGQFGQIFPMDDVEELSVLISNALNNNINADKDKTALNQYLHDHKKNIVAKEYIKIFSI
jgi:glycogen(starch) synthase